MAGDHTHRMSTPGSIKDQYFENYEKKYVRSISCSLMAPTVC